MKRTFFIIPMVLSLLSIFILISSCKKDKNEDNTSVTNGFSVNGTSYSTPKGYICFPLTLKSDPNGYYFILVSNSINCQWSTNVDDVRATGIGNFVTFTLWSATSDKPAVGDYSFHKQTVTRDPFEFDGRTVGINVNCTTEEGGTHYDIIGGTIKLNESGANYNLTYNFTCTEGKTISGSYNGSLQLITPSTF